MPADRFKDSGETLPENSGDSGKNLAVISLALDKMHEAVYLIQESGRIQFANNAASVMLGYTHDEFLTMSVSDINPEFPEEKWKLLWKRLKEEGTLTFEGVHQAKDGRRIPIEIKGSYIEHERNQYVLGLVTDIRQRRQAEQRLKEAYDRLNLVLDATQIGIFDWDLVNDRWYTSKVYNQVIGFSPPTNVSERGKWMELIHPEDQSVVKSMVERALSGRFETYQYEARMRYADGNYHWYSVKGFPQQRSQDGRVTRMVGIRTDITQSKQDEENLRKTNRELRAISNCNQALLRAEEEQTLLSEICRIICEEAGYTTAWVGYVDEKKRQVLPAVWAGQDSAYIKDIKVVWENTDDFRKVPLGRAILSGEQVYESDFYSVPGNPFWKENALDHGYGSGIVLPLKKNKTEVFGVLLIYSLEREAISPDEIRLLTELAGDLAFGISSLRVRKEHSEYFTRIEESMAKTVQTIATMVEIRDPYTAGHQKRTATLAAAIARELGKDEEEIKGITIAALIHDIGNISIPAEILTRPGKLTETELELVRTHAATGFDLIKNIDFPWPVAKIVRQHHERLNGSGYPDKLHRDQIVDGARIIAVADVVEAMASHRPYRTALGMERTLEELQKNRGILYDERVVDACLRLFHKKNFKFENEK